MGKYATTIKGKVQVVVVDRDGRIIKRHTQPMRSFTSNFSQVLASLFAMPLAGTSQTTSETAYRVIVSTPYSPTDTSGLASPLPIATMVASGGSSVSFSIMGLKAPAGNTDYGVQIGFGTSAPSPSDIMLASQYSASDFDYSEVTVEAPTVSGNTTQFRVIRSFINKSGVDKSVSETGLMALHNWQIGSTINTIRYLIARDVFSTPISVPALGTLTIRYVISITT